PAAVDCLLVNATGELKYFYEHAIIIFVGKRLTAQGGQNPIEPGVLGKAMVFGTNMQNFESIAKAFVEQRAALQVRDADELESALGLLLSDPDQAAQLGNNAVRVVRENLGGIQRTVDMIVEQLDGGDIYVAPRRQQTATKATSQP